MTNISNSVPSPAQPLLSSNNKIDMNIINDQIDNNFNIIQNKRYFSDKPLRIISRSDLR